MTLIIKNFGILFASLLSYKKIRNERYNLLKFCLLTIFCILFSVILSCVDVKNSMLTIPIMLVAFCIIMGLYGDKDNPNVFALSLFIFSINYIIFVISVVITSVLMLFISYEFGKKYGQGFAVIVQFICIAALLKSSRLRRGILSLQRTIYSMQGIIISMLIIFFAPLINNGAYDHIYIIVYTCVFILAVLIFVYWRTAITKYYLERLILRDNDLLNAELEEKNAYIEKLLRDKEQLEKLNHKNYKLIPAMQVAVTHYINGVNAYMLSSDMIPVLAETAVAVEDTEVDIEFDNFIKEGNKLIKELEKMKAEWTELVNSENLSELNDLPSCGVSRLDYILSYMYERQLKEDFSLKVDVECSLDKLTDRIISEEDLATLVADLLENAIIATRYNERKEILIRLGIMGKEYTIEVYDSGIPFDKEVLAKYGREQITTHADESGSGIGLMQMSEILSKCGASLYIEEYSEGERSHTKRISVVFNRKHQYVLYTCRSDEDIAYLKKRSDLMVIKK